MGNPPDEAMRDRAATAIQNQVQAGNTWREPAAGGPRVLFIAGFAL
jgi:hypothetical protein